MRTALVLVACAAALTACGKVGDLERPGPMFGKAATDAPAAPAQDPAAPVSTVDPRDRSTDVSPRVPEPGRPSDPFARPALPGAAPDPATAPR